jgi:predicted HTH domain antitoxin
MEKKYNLSKVKSYRLSDNALASISYISKSRNINESEVTRIVIDKGIKEYLFESAVNEYNTKKICLSEAAKIAGLSKRDFMEELEKRGIPLNLDKEAFKYSFDSMERILKKIDGKGKK